MIRISIISILSIVLFGCTKTITQVKYVSTPLSRPTMPSLEKVKGIDMSCLSNETKEKLIKRDNQIKYYIGELETIIDSTRE